MLSYKYRTLPGCRLADSRGAMSGAVLDQQILFMVRTMTIKEAKTILNSLPLRIYSDEEIIKAYERLKKTNLLTKKMVSNLVDRFPPKPSPTF